MRCCIRIALVPVFPFAFVLGVICGDIAECPAVEDCGHNVLPADYAMLLQLSTVTVINATSLNKAQTDVTTQAFKKENGEMRPQLSNNQTRDVLFIAGINDTAMTDWASASDQVCIVVGVVLVFCCLVVLCCACSGESVEKNTVDEHAIPGFAKCIVPAKEVAKEDARCCVFSLPRSTQRKNHGKALSGAVSRPSSSASNIEEIFEAATKSVALGEVVPSLGNEQKLFMYAHFKQATQGDATGPRPSMFDPVARAKFDAWKDLNGTDRVSAMQSYVEKADRLAPVWRDET